MDLPLTMGPEDMYLSNEPKTLTETPRKRGRGKKQTMPTDSDPSLDVVDDDEQGSPAKKNKTKSPGKRAGVMGSIPTTYKEAGPADKILLQMKDSENKPWAEIKKALEEMTGAKLGSNTAQMRYARMKVNFVVFEKYDEPRLLQKKKEIEERFEIEKWQKIADGIQEMGGNKYPSAAVQKKFKEMSKKADME